METQYNAQSIRILKPEEITARFEWVQIAELSRKFKRPEEWIERGFRACEEVGVSTDYFVERYLERLDVPFREDVDAAFKALHVWKCLDGA